MNAEERQLTMHVLDERISWLRRQIRDLERDEQFRAATLASYRTELAVAVTASESLQEEKDDTGREHGHA